MYELIEHRRLDSAASSITFSNIPQDGSDLLIVGSFRFDRATRDTPVRMLLNGAGFTARNLFGYPTSVGSQTPTTNYIGWAPAATNTANTFGNFSVVISNYTATGAKSFSVDIVQEDNQAGAFLTITAGSSSTTTAITTVTFSDEAVGANLVAGSSATLYKVNRRSGIGRAPLAMGGYMSYSNGYWVHTFPSSGSFIPFTNMDVEYLVVAGGGGGGGRHAGGGGAGGYREVTSQALTANINYTITIGAGGAGAINGDTNASRQGSSGSNSVFNTITSAGGGGGGGAVSEAGANGGSGGGGTYQGPVGIGNTPSVSPSQGNNGGSGTQPSGPTYQGGGGGGAGSVGGSAVPGQAGNGGSGAVSSITGTPVFRAAGGGGGGWTGSQAGLGGVGGGGDGVGLAGSSAAGNGTTNSGSGGGGGGGASSAGGNGGSGIVIVRYRA